MADMYKNQLQELAQRSCFNLPSYTSIREGPDHAPRFKASVNFNGEIFESPAYSPTLRLAEHAAAEVALSALSTKGLSRSLTSRVLDETGVYKNLLQETAHRAGLSLPVYTTIRSGPGHVPIFTSTVELAGLSFTGESARTKKQAEKNAAIAAWSSLKRLPDLGKQSQGNWEEKKDQTIVARALSHLGPKEESKSIRGRDRNQARRKMQSKDDGVYSSSHLRHMDLLGDSSSISTGSTLRQTANKKSIVNLLPPPPARVASIILPQLSSTSLKKNQTIHQLANRPPNPIKTVGNSGVTKQEEHPHRQRDKAEDEFQWLKWKAEIIETEEGGLNLGRSNSSAVHRANANLVHRQRPYALQPTMASTTAGKLLDTQTAQCHVKTRLLGPPTASQMVLAPNCGQMYTNRPAPAVQIRSVIPVCAAPPPPLPPMSIQPSESPHPSNTEIRTSISTQAGVEALSARPDRLKSALLLTKSYSCEKRNKTS